LTNDLTNAQRGTHPGRPPNIRPVVVRSRYPFLNKQRHRWFVRIVVPADVRDIIGQSIFKVPTGHL
jgi:hypothetical protein